MIRTTGVLAWTVMAALGVVLVPATYNTFQARKTAHLLLRSQISAASSRPAFPGREGTLATIATRLHTNSVPLEELRTALQNPIRDWYLGLASWENGDEDQAVEFFAEAANQPTVGLWRQAGGLEWSPLRRNLARAMIGLQLENAPHMPITPETVLDSPLTPLEKRVTLSWLGVKAFDEGQWGTAARYQRLAMELGSRSPTVWARTVASLALEGDYGLARMIADQSGLPTSSVLGLATKLAQGYDANTISSSLSPVFDLALRRRSAAVSRAVDWMQTQEFLVAPNPQNLPPIIPQLLGQDPIRLWFAAERFEAVGKSSEAYQIYERLQGLRPTLVGTLRTRLIEGGPQALLEVDPTPYLAPGQKPLWHATASALQNEFQLPRMKSAAAVIFDRPIMVPLQITESGPVQIVLVASGTPSHNIAPVVTVSRANKPILSLAFSSESFEAQQALLDLSIGETKLQLEFSNPSEAPDSNGSQRALRLSHILITQQTNR